MRVASPGPSAAAIVGGGRGAVLGAAVSTWLNRPWFWRDSKANMQIYGAHKIRRQRARGGLFVARRMVERLMLRQGLGATSSGNEAPRSLSIVSHPRPSISCLPAPIADFLVKRPGVTVKPSRASRKACATSSPHGRSIWPSRSCRSQHPPVAVQRYRMPFVAVLSRISARWRSTPT